MSDGRVCVDHLLEELHRVRLRFEQEYDITVAEFVGCLESVKFQILFDIQENEGDEHDE